MTEDQADMWKKAPTKEEWVEWAMANRAAIALESDELTGADLNEAVAKRLGIVHTRYNGQVVDQFGNPLMYDEDWALAGEIIEREWLDITPWPNESREDMRWQCQQHDTANDCIQYGPTPLIAAMRCYVASKQGEMK